tara:strand:+ start:2101 stop:2388 length:288 start_codon:yes stop_codon:yes gene_type:complete
MDLLDFYQLIFNIKFSKKSPQADSLEQHYIFNLAAKYNICIVHRNFSHVLENNKVLYNVALGEYLENIKKRKHLVVNFYTADRKIISEGYIYIKD